MFRWLENITDRFSPRAHYPVDTDNGYSLSEAIERVIDGIDPKLRFVPAYQNKLRKEVAVSLEHIGRLVDKIPGPIDVSRKTFVSNPEVRAYFSTPDALQEIFSCGTELKTFFEQRGNDSLEESCALLCANREEKKQAGLALKGEVLRRDVMQTSIHFFDYKIMSPAANEVDVRTGIKRCIFDGMITYALQHIATFKSERLDLANRRRMLHSQLRSRQAQGNGLSTMLAEAHSQVDKLESDIKQAEKRLEEMTGEKDVLSFYLEEIRKVLEHPEDFIKLNVACFRLNDMGVKVNDEADQSSNVVCFSEVEITDVMKRVVTVIRYNKDEIHCKKSLS